jgi:hypothetical protein
VDLMETSATWNNGSGWANEEPFTADELTNLDNVRLACNRLAESIEAFIDVHDELDPDNH